MTVAYVAEHSVSFRGRIPSLVLLFIISCISGRMAVLLLIKTVGWSYGRVKRGVVLSAETIVARMEPTDARRKKKGSAETPTWICNLSGRRQRQGLRSITFRNADRVVCIKEYISAECLPLDTLLRVTYPAASVTAGRRRYFGLALLTCRKGHTTQYRRRDLWLTCL